MIRAQWIAAAVCGLTAIGSVAGAATTVFGDFENGTTGGFGTLGNAGVTPNTFSNATAEIITPTTGGNLTKVLHLTATGYTGNDLAFDFAASGLTAAFQANSVLSFDWQVAPSSAAAGYSQLYNIVLNAAGAGYQSVGGTGAAAGPYNTAVGTVNQNPPYTGQVNHVTIDYSAYKAAITGTGYLQFAITTNNGGGAPSDFYFDNFTLSSVPEPTSLAAVALGAAGLVSRRRRSV